MKLPARKLAVVRRACRVVLRPLRHLTTQINLSGSKIAPALIEMLYVCHLLKVPSLVCSLAQAFAEAGLLLRFHHHHRTWFRNQGLLEHKEANYINLLAHPIGERTVSWRVWAPTMLELGGKDAAVVLKMPTWEHAAKQIVGGIQLLGQLGIKVKRVIVIESVADKLAALGLRQR